MTRYGIVSRYNGRFHEEVNLDQPGAKADKVLPENHRFVSIMWAGGWDEYIVDMSTVRPMTEEESAKVKKERAAGHGVQPINNKYLLGIFSKKLIGEGNCVKIISHLAGGD